MHASNAHLFAFWYPTLSAEIKGAQKTLQIKESTLITRISAVLRLQVNESFLLFDRTLHVPVVITEINKKYIAVLCGTVEKNNLYTPSITAILPLLKKDDLATALVQLVASGISAVQLVLTQGVQRTWGGAHEHDRLERLMIAAAEQSKHFALPFLHEPIPLAMAVLKHKNIVYGDADGKPFKEIFNDLPVLIKECAVLVGPESDFALDEKVLLHTHGVVGYSLTPTVLRSYLAITIITGALRSWYYKKE